MFTFRDYNTHNQGSDLDVFETSLKCTLDICVLFELVLS